MMVPAHGVSDRHVAPRAVQRAQLGALLGEMNQYWEGNVGHLNRLLQSARTILASRSTATVPLSTRNSPRATTFLPNSI